jgi:hypothetical protein
MNTLTARLAAIEHRWPSCSGCNGVLGIDMPIPRGTSDEDVDWSRVERERICVACKRPRRLRVYQLELDESA